MGNVAGQQMGCPRLYGGQQYRAVFLWELNQPQNRSIRWRDDDNADSVKQSIEIRTLRMIAKIPPRLFDGIRRRQELHVG